jgi:hypothetical protein
MERQANWHQLLIVPSSLRHLCRSNWDRRARPFQFPIPLLKGVVEAALHEDLPGFPAQKSGEGSP